MFSKLVASEPENAPRTQRSAGMMLSVFLHTALGYGALAATMPDESAHDTPVRVDSLILYPPSTTNRPRPVSDTPVDRRIMRPRPLTTIVIDQTPWATITPTTIPPVNSGEEWDPTPWAPNRTTCSAFECVVEVPAGESGGFFSIVTVDEIPERIAGPPPRYPEMLRHAGIEGWVLVEFVVDTTGKVETGSARVVESTSRAFDRPALDMIEQSQFRPGRIRGQPVRVMVQQRVAFSIERRTHDMR